MSQSPGTSPGAEPVTPKVLSVKQVAVLLSLSVNTVYDLVGDGSIKATKVKGSIRIRPEWVDQYLDSLPSYAPESA